MTKKELSAAMRELGRRYGSKAGKASAAKLSPEERAARARKAGLASGAARKAAKQA